MKKTITLQFCSIQYKFITDIYAKFGIPNLPHSPHIGQNTNGDITHFRIFGQFFLKENCHNSRASDDVDMKRKAVTKPDKRSKARSKNVNNDVKSGNCWSIWRNLEAWFWTHSL